MSAGTVNAHTCVLHLHVFARNAAEVPKSPRLSVAAIFYISVTLRQEQQLKMITVGRRKDIHTPALAPGL
jgi:hypothetical protein